MVGKFSLFVFIVLAFNAAFAQPGEQPIQLGINTHQGFLFNNSFKRTNTDKLSLRSISGIEINAAWQTLGTKPWHKYFGFPKWGASFFYYSIGTGKTYIDYEHDKNLYSVNWGNCYALLIHSSFKPIATRFFEMNVRLGTGLGYFTSVYNAQNNPGDIWISSRVSPSMHLNVEGQFNLSARWAIVLGGAFTHFSNGALKMPNLGVNLPTANIGLRITPFPERIQYKRDSIYPAAKKDYFYFSFAGGAKVLPDYGTTYYPTVAASFMYGRRVGKISKLLVSFDAFRDGSLLADSVYRKKDINRYGIWFGHEFMHGRLGLLFGAGYYLYDQTHRDEPVYLKVGLRQYFHRHFFAGVILKSHYARADNVEWTLGYTFKER